MSEATGAEVRTGSTDPDGYDWRPMIDANTAAGKAVDAITRDTARAYLAACRAGTDAAMESAARAAEAVLLDASRRLADCARGYANRAEWITSPDAVLLDVLSDPDA